MALAESALGTFDAFTRAVLRRRPADARVLVCSDHGNVEDLRTRNHTLGAGAAAVVSLRWTARGAGDGGGRGGADRREPAA